MNDPFFDLFPDPRLLRAIPHTRTSNGASRRQAYDSFLCKHCHALVSTASFLSGVQNRNHCPYCLWSRHLDLFAAGDRLSACKAPMRPIGLTFKSTPKKYGSGNGELMLIHVCTECESLSINRVAADDDLQTIYRVFEASFQLDVCLQTRLDIHGIRALTEEDRELVITQLFGQGADLAKVLLLDDVVTA
jgi:hypothetical protein